MKPGEKVIQILQADEKARKVLEAYHKAAIKDGVTPETKEYQDGKNTVMMLAIAFNEEAMKAMAEEVYHKLQNK